METKWSISLCQQCVSDSKIKQPRKSENRFLLGFLQRGTINKLFDDGKFIKFFQVYDGDKNIESLIKTTQLGHWIKIDNVNLRHQLENIILNSKFISPELTHHERGL